MAIIQSALLSKGRGSAGSVTFRRVNGKTVVSEKPIEVKNPRTYPQQLQRAYMLMASRFVGGLGEYFRERQKVSRIYDGNLSQRGSLLSARQYLGGVLQRLLKANIPVNEHIAGLIVANQPLPAFLYYSPVVGDDYYRSYGQLDITGLPRVNNSVKAADVDVNTVSSAEGVLAHFNINGVVGGNRKGVIMNCTYSALYFVGDADTPMLLHFRSATGKVRVISEEQGIFSVTADLMLPVGATIVASIVEMTPLSSVELEISVTEDVSTIAEPIGLVDWHYGTPPTPQT